MGYFGKVKQREEAVRLRKKRVINKEDRANTAGFSLIS